MRKFAFIFILLVSGAKFAHANQDFYGNLFVNAAVWRASNTCSADSFVAIATNPINFGGVTVLSSGTDPSKIAFFDGSNNLQVGTIAVSGLNMGIPIGFGISFSSGGLRYTNAGGSCISILWQYKKNPDPGR